MLTAIKTYSKLIWSALLTFGASLLTFLLMRSGQNKREKKRIEARYEKAKDVMEKDVEIDREYDKRTEELAREVEEKRTSGELSDPNRW